MPKPSSSRSGSSRGAPGWADRLLAATRADEEATADEDAPKGPPWTYKFDDPFTVNLYEPTSRWFLQLFLQIEVASPEVLSKFDRNVAPLRDTIILLLSSKTKQELSSIDGKLKLKQEIIIRSENVLGKGAVKTVYFTEFTILNQ